MFSYRRQNGNMFHAFPFRSDQRVHKLALFIIMIMIRKINKNLEFIPICTYNPTLLNPKNCSINFPFFFAGGGSRLSFHLRCRVVENSSKIHKQKTKNETCFHRSWAGCWIIIIIISVNIVINHK